MRASSTGSTTWRWTGRATSTRPRSTTPSVCRSSSIRASSPSPPTEPVLVRILYQGGTYDRGGWRRGGGGAPGGGGPPVLGAAPGGGGRGGGGGPRGGAPP